MLRSLVSRFSSVRVLVVGDLLADHYVFGQTERVSREAPVLIVRHEREEVRLGGGANAAANARALGAKVTVLGVLGPDAVGGALRSQFETQGVKVVPVRAPQTETRTRVLAGGVSTTRQQMLRIDRGASGPLSESIQRALAAKLLLHGAKADVIVVSDYGAGVLNAQTRSALGVLAGRGVQVCVDSRFSLGSYVGLTMCKPNEPELAALTGLELRDVATLERAGRAALTRLKCRVLLVTRGRHGMSVFEPGAEPIHVPVHGSEDAVDVTGAGDTVNATFSVALAAGASPRDAAQLANVAGALVVQKEGTATVTQSELAAALRVATRAS